LAVALLVAVVGVGWRERAALSQAFGFSAGGAEAAGSAQDRRAPVITAAVETAQDDISVDVVGTGRAKRSVMLRAETAGKVARAPLDEGRVFAQGEMLLELDAEQERLAVALAEARLEEAERTRRRFSRLKSQGNVAIATLEEAETLARIARLELDRAQADLADRLVRAPFDGMPGLTDVEVGAWIDSDVAIASFDDRSEIVVEFDLPEALIARVRPEMPVTATTPAAPGRRFDGVVAAIDSRVDAQSRTIKVRVAIPNAEDLLRPGASFAVRLDLPGGRYARVPELALQFARSALHVWRVREGRAERVEVALIRRLDGAALVDGALAAGDVVVVEGTQRLVDGKPVRVLEGAGV